MKYTKVVLAAALAAFLGYAGTAKGVATLTMQAVSGGVTNTVVITDNGAGDSQPATLGAITWVGSVGVFTLNVNTGLTKPQLGTATAPHMDLNFITQSVVAGQLTITFSDDGYTYSGGLQDAVGGTTSGMGNTVVDRVFRDGTLVTQQGPFGPTAFSATTVGTVTLAPSNTLSLVVIINHGTAGGNTSGNKDVNRVPDGGTTVMLLGAALSGLGLMRKKLKA